MSNKCTLKAEAISWDTPPLIFDYIVVSYMKIKLFKTNCFSIPDAIQLEMRFSVLLLGEYYCSTNDASYASI